MLSQLKLEKFKRLNEAVHPGLLTEDELTKLEDMVLSEKFGKLRKRGGFAKFNTNAVGGIIHSIYDLESDNGSNYLLAGYGTTVKTSPDGTGAWSLAISGLSGMGKFQLQPYAGKFYLTDGVIAPKVLGGSALADTWSLEIAAPDVSLVTTGHNASGNLTASKTYKWVLVYVTIEGIISPPSQPITHLISGADVVTTDGTNKCIGFQGLPVSADTRVTGRLIYRTLNDSDVYYFHSQIDNIRTTWYDDIADSELGSETFEYLNAPQTAKYNCIHKERLWFANQTRKVKNWVTPAHTKMPGSGFDASNGYTTKTFTAGVGLNSNLVASVPGSTLATGYTYTYRFVFFDANGIMSDYVDSGSSSITIAGQGIYIYGQPFVANEYTAVTLGAVYRKTVSISSPTGDEVFKLLSNYKVNVPISERGIFVDDGSWTETTTWASNQSTDSEVTGVSHSDIAKPPVFILEDIRDVYPDDGDAITGIYDDVNGVLVFKETSICKIYTEGATQNWRLVKLVSTIGAEANTITKFGNEYCFVFQKKYYKYNSHSGQIDQQTNEFIKTSLAAVTTFHSAITSKTWFLLGVTGGSFTQNYGLFVYDFVAESWYKFNYYDVPYAMAIKQHGASAGSILIASGQYVLYYGTGTIDENTVSSTQADVSPLVRSKTFGDGISEVRAREFDFNYLKQDNKNLVVTVVNADSAATNTHTDTTNATNSTDYKLFEQETGREDDDFKKGAKFYFQFAGAGLTEFDVFRFKFRPIREGKAVV